jgi:hypothetical protein
MKSSVFVRPNLKLFLIAALAIAVLQDIITNGQGETSILTTRATKPADSERELRDLLDKLENAPSSELYARIGNCFQRRGDLKNAQLYFRRAELLSEVED